MTTEATKRDQLLTEYESADKSYSEWKDYRDSVRKQIVTEFSTGEKEEGTENVLSDDGRTVNMDHKRYWKMANKQHETQKLCADIAPERATTLFTWEATLNKKAFRNLELLSQAEIEAGNPEGENTQLLKAIMALLTITPGACQVKIKPAK